jgi:hypothetical protein
MRCVVASLALLGLAACAPPPLDCVQPLDLSCAPLYPPTFDDVFHDTLLPKCSTGGGSCHTPTGHMAGLSFDKNNEDDAYQQLLMPSTTIPGRFRVIPGNASCSELVERIYSNEDYWHMPRGAQLADGEKCSIAQWVEGGALRVPMPDAALPDAMPAMVDAQ